MKGSVDTTTFINENTSKTIQERNDPPAGSYQSSS